MYKEEENSFERNTQRWTSAEQAEIHKVSRSSKSPADELLCLSGK